MEEKEPETKKKAGRPKLDPDELRGSVIGVRVSADEYAELRAKAAKLGITPAQWLRESALTRTLPVPPAPVIEQAQYDALAKQAADENEKRLGPLVDKLELLPIQIESVRQQNQRGDALTTLTNQVERQSAAIKNLTDETAQTLTEIVRQNAEQNERTIATLNRAAQSSEYAIEAAGRRMKLAHYAQTVAVGVAVAVLVVGIGWFFLKPETKIESQSTVVEAVKPDQKHKP